MSDAERELKPCPFCGGEASDRESSYLGHGLHTNGPSWRIVGCFECGIVFSERDAVGVPVILRRGWPAKMWNTRS